MSDDDKQNITSLISNAVLMVTAGWGLKECLELPFVSAGFGLFAVRGLIGTISYFNIDNETFDKVQKHYFKIVDNFGFPLLAMDIMGCKCIRPEWNILQLLGPAVDFVGYEMDGDIGQLLNVSHAATAGGAFVCAQQKPFYWGSALFPVPFIADLLVRVLGDVEDYHEVFLVMGNILALGVLTDQVP